MIKNVHWSSCKVLEFSWHILEKYSNNKFHENPSSGGRIAPCRQTDRQTNKWTDGETESLFETLWTRLKSWEWIYCSGTCGGQKVALLLNQAPLHQYVRGSAGIASWILKLGAGWRRAVSSMIQTLYSRRKSSDNHGFAHIYQAMLFFLFGSQKQGIRSVKQ